MYSRLNEVERVREVFIPKRVNRKGKRFGFARFGSNIDKTRVEQELNGLWFGSYKLRANLAKFDRKSSSNKPDSHPKSLHHGSPDSDQGKAWRIRDFSYAEVVRGSSSQSNANTANHHQDDSSSTSLRYVSSEEDRVRLKKYFTGILKEKFLFIDVGKNIKEACHGVLTINYLGGELVLIQAASEMDIQEKDLERIAYWFESIRPWRERDVDNSRVIWTQWFGVPMHAWNPKFFKLVSTKFGSLIRLDEDTINRSNLQTARALIRTSRPEIPKEAFSVSIDGRMFPIRIREESEDVEDEYEEWSSDDGEDDYEDDSSTSMDSDDEVIPVLRSIGGGVKGVASTQGHEERLEFRDVALMASQESRGGIHAHGLGIMETIYPNKSEEVAVNTRISDRVVDIPHDQRVVGYKAGLENINAESELGKLCTKKVDNSVLPAQKIESAQTSGKILMDLNGPRLLDGPIHPSAEISLGNQDEDLMDTKSDSSCSQNSQTSDEQDTPHGDETKSGVVGVNANNIQGKAVAKSKKKRRNKNPTLDRWVEHQRSSIHKDEAENLGCGSQGMGCREKTGLNRESYRRSNYQPHEGFG
ncbi:hypothetical protein ACS0TY_029556 [Phlomoides rotata]